MASSAPHSRPHPWNAKSTSKILDIFEGTQQLVVARRVLGPS
ncbi:hypothetical protein [Nocardia africana]|uniref:Uncharacterized protein n=1 Tax=Nocardia africana TaxID=134964 RepID=A0ABW6NSV0_9NOCA